MNGNDSNFPEAGTTGAYAASSTGDAASSTAASGSSASSYGSAPYGSASYGSAPYGAAPGGDPAGYPPYGYGAVPPPPPPGAPNPGLAGLLGLIPGVGAMYNGQFAKGLAHIVIFAILVSLADHVNGIFGLLVTGWVFYMIFDAYQTARARREGLVAPDPFGLNTIGERFGMPGTGPNWSDFVARPAAGSTANGPAGNSNPYAGPVVDPAAPAYDPAAYVAPPQGYAAAPQYNAPYPGTSPQDVAAAYRDTYAYPGPSAGYPAGTVPPPPYTSPYANAFTPGSPFIPPVPVAPVNNAGLPTGAIWLIGLGALALVGSLARSFYWSGHILGTFGLLVIGVVLLVTRTLSARHVYPEGTAAYRWSLLHANRGSFALVVAGILQALNGLNVAYWDHTWPYLLIAVGLYQVLDRALYNRMLAEEPLPVDPYAAAAAQPYTTAPQQPVTETEGEVR